jgi:hypothetical protein
VMMLRPALDQCKRSLRPLRHRAPASITGSVTDVWF